MSIFGSVWGFETPVGGNHHLAAEADLFRAEGRSPANNVKVSHAITGHIVGGVAAFEPKGHRIKICEGGGVSIVVTDTTGTPTVTALTAGLSCNSAGCSTIGNLTATEKYKAVSNDGKDTDRVTLLPVP